MFRSATVSVGGGGLWDTKRACGLPHSINNFNAIGCHYEHCCSFMSTFQKSLFSVAHILVFTMSQY